MYFISHSAIMRLFHTKLYEGEAVIDNISLSH